jgi:hypothetical protein
MSDRRWKLEFSVREEGPGGPSAVADAEDAEAGSARQEQ